MVRLRFFYRTLGMIWLFLGGWILVISLGFLLIPTVLNAFFQAEIPLLALVLAPSLQAVPTLQQIAGLTLGLFCVSFGIGLFSLRSWARTIGVAFNILMGGCLAALALMLYFRMTSVGAQASSSSATLVLLLGGLCSLGLLATGLQLSFPSAMDAFFGFLPKPPPAPAAKCPTCGGPLDLEKARCPKCDADNGDMISPPVRARLIGQEGQEFLVSLRRPTRIGRDTPGFEVLIDDVTVSHEHAVIEFVDGRFYLHRLKDINGTFVNGVRVQDTEIKNGDQISFGRAAFRFITE